MNDGDAALVQYVRAAYGESMADRVEELLANDPDNKTGFARHMRRSVAREIEESARRLCTETR